MIRLLKLYWQCVLKPIPDEDRGWWQANGM
jgi:hypothetical protein